MASVPLLAAVGSWQLAAVMIFLERMGRATRNPPRDVMLAQAGGQMGLGWAFGINEGLDQLGALMGPLAVAALLASRHGYSLAFAALAIPATMTLLLVGSARVGFPYAGAVEHEPAQAAAGRYPRVLVVLSRHGTGGIRVCRLLAHRLPHEPRARGPRSVDRGALSMITMCLLSDRQVIQREGSSIPAGTASAGRVIELEYDVVIGVQSHQDCLGHVISH